MEYFKPKFWLGMTASPDTNNYDIYEIFNHNIIYEITLQQALNEDLLCTFHYFGITDLSFDDVELTDDTDVNFLNLKSSERVDHILNQAEYYGYCGDRVKGLIFCRTIEEAKELSSAFNKKVHPKGDFYKTEVISGENSQQEREEAIHKLTTDSECDEQLDYIFTVDVFNEGIDIPEINQVILLRPTQSIVVFIQQLGRGLRKCNNKEYVVIIDFIANYTNNFMIPMALYGDRSFNKDTMRRYVREGENLIPGASSVHFDEISRKKIYESIDKAKTNSSMIITEAYESLKKRLNRIPTISDFEDYGSIDITKIFNNYQSYHEFLKKKEGNSYLNINCLSPEMEEIIIFISSKLVLFKRIQDILLLKTLVSNLSNTNVSYASIFKNQKNSLDAEMSVFNNLTNQFPITATQEKFANCVLIERNSDDTYSLMPKFKSLLQNNVFYEMVNELLDFGITQVQKNYSELYKDTNFQLYQKYTYEDVCRLLNWKQNLNAQNIGGYFYNKDTKTFPVFINYDKSENAINYEDKFTSEDTLFAISKRKRTANSPDANYIYKRPGYEDTRIFLFVRKNKDDKETKEFYFLGEMNAYGSPQEEYIVSDDAKANKSTVFGIIYKLDNPVRSDIYDYIVYD